MEQTYQVSILARPEGRALLAKGDARVDNMLGVSILARPEGRALLALRSRSCGRCNVSILARPEGRALRVSRGAFFFYGKFQSSPAPKGGRYKSTYVVALSGVYVSILARPEGRALRAILARARDKLYVSILARPEGRALHDTRSIQFDNARFQSSPAPKGGRYPIPLKKH